MNNSIIISVILVVLNNRKYITKAIQNYIDQQCDASELIIVDGASTDGTKEIIETYALNNPKIRWISEKDNGQSDAMNKGIRMALGEYVSFLNVDDYYEPNTLNQVVQLLKNGEKAEFIVGNCNVWDSEGKLIYVNRPQKLKPWHILSGRYLPVNPSAYFYKKSIHERVGYYRVENHYNMDIEFIIMASTVSKMKYVDRTWGNFRVLPNTKTGSDADEGKMLERKNNLFKLKLQELGIYITLRTKLFLYYVYYKNDFKKRWKLK